MSIWGCSILNAHKHTLTQTQPPYTHSAWPLVQFISCYSCPVVVVVFSVISGWGLSSIAGLGVCVCVCMSEVSVPAVMASQRESAYLRSLLISVRQPPLSYSAGDSGLTLGTR